jgi:hypothetical protein
MRDLRPPIGRTRLRRVRNRFARDAAYASEWDAKM